MSLQHKRSSIAHKRPVATSLNDGQLALNLNATSPGVFFKNSSNVLTKVGPVHIGTSAPNSSPATGGSTGNSIGEQWLDTTGGTYVLKIWDGTAWRSETGTFVDVSGDTMTGALILPSGTEAAPALGVGSSDNGLYLPATDELGVSTNGSERLRIDSLGRLLVGVSTAQAAQQIQAANTGGENLGTFRFANNQGPSDIALHKSRGSLGSHTILQNNDVIGSIAFRGSDGSAFRNAAMIDGQVDGTPGSSDMPGRLVFKTTADGASSPTERMRIDSSGNVGIGTSSPMTDAQLTLAAPLDVALGFKRTDSGRFDAGIKVSGGHMTFHTGSDSTTVGSIAERIRIDSSGRILIAATSSYASSNADDLQIGDNTASAQSGITLGSTTASSIRFRDGADAGILSYVHSDNSMRFFTSDSERMRIDGSGNVGIGTTNATRTLTVAGDESQKLTNSSAFEVIKKSISHQYTNLGTTAVAMGEALSSNAAMVAVFLTNKDGDQATFMFTTGKESAVAHKYSLVSGSAVNCSVSLSTATFSISGMGDGRTYTLVFSTSSIANAASLKASSTATGTTKIAMCAIGAF